MAETKQKDDKSPLDTIKAARELWLIATSKSELEEVETMYRHALTSKVLPADDYESDEPATKKRKSHHRLSRSDYRQASEKLALLLCQSGRCKKAKKPLSLLGFTCRLAENILDYPTDNSKDQITGRCGSKSIPCQIIDDFLTKKQLERLAGLFSSPSAKYWTIHNYRVEPPSPYFSYVLPLYEINKFGFIGGLIEKILSCPMITKKFPALSDTKFVEMWAHNRPHASGHQMHFDSDDEGRGGVRNPIISTILYITAGRNDEDTTLFTGGPSLVTNQKVENDHLATRGWLAHPRPKRLVAFDGKYLHGVIPGKGVSSKDGRRVTLMFAFWRDIKVRRGLGPGSARPFPVKMNNNTIPEWTQGLVDPLDELESDKCPYKTCKETSPIELDVVYEKLNGKPWKKSDGMPTYDKVFQGF
jgi:methyl-CpG-binding domain protein 4